MEKISSIKLSGMIAYRQAPPDTLIKKDTARTDTAATAKVNAEINEAMAYVNSEEIQKTVREELEKARIEKDKARIEADKARIEKDKAQIEADKARIEKDKARIEANKARIEADKARIEADKIRIEADRARIASPEKNTLILLDGKEITREEMDQIPPAQIESVTVLKNSPAILKYGEKAADGVIEITLKKEVE
jgi:outer membrane receptor for ferrienterochelin and colicin